MGALEKEMPHGMVADNPGRARPPGAVLADRPDREAALTFWSASSAILAECATLLPPGAIACWIVKPFVRGGKLVEFPAQWQALCEHRGFTLLERIECSLVEDHGTQETLFGGAENVTTSRMSFFRRLSIKKGAPPINAEIILVFRKQ